ncbi:hypothetical protein [Xenorhabdus taiwanensis]|uniref:Uncharacterized protein n=1 Tax=Xenorhabdus taiwanensis TaxID=3085177 RepID=A0ABM8JZF3_9GAMM|nr:hypothetical protein TCT1_21970 [Xenorhabdus sp. TCT-1]BET97818.1 hypothetical protein TCT1_27390 [Xenorhabdus sp. TCT-1]BET98085.1 hypothetical protein TCT1_30060 [Xenorhabdus sp. TCT-1]
MDWGAFLTTNEGIPWWTPKTTPLSFVRKISVTIGRWYEGIDTHISTTQPCMAFMCAHTDSVENAPYGELSSGKSRWHIELSAPDSRTPTVCEIYLFTLVYPQPVPDWGIAVWDENGKCVMTSDTNPLAIEGEYNTNQQMTLRGKKALLMQTTGLISSSIEPPGELPILQYRDTSFSAFFNGHSTQFVPAAVSGPLSWIVEFSIEDLTSPYIDCALYDV